MIAVFATLQLENFLTQGRHQNQEVIFKNKGGADPLSISNSNKTLQKGL